MSEKYERMSERLKLVVNLDSGRIHRRRWDAQSKSWYDNPRCNLDDIVRRIEVDTREAANEALGGRKPRACLRCFPAPTPEEVAMNEAVPVAEAAYNPDDLSQEQPSDD